MSCWYCGSILVSYKRGGRFEPFCCNEKYVLSLNLVNSVKHLGKTSIKLKIKPKNGHNEPRISFFKNESKVEIIDVTEAMIGPKD